MGFEMTTKPVKGIRIKGNKIKSDVMISRKGKDFSSVLDSDTDQSMKRPRNQFSYSPVRPSVKKGKTNNSAFKSP